MTTGAPWGRSSTGGSSRAAGAGWAPSPRAARRGGLGARRRGLLGGGPLGGGLGGRLGGGLGRGGAAGTGAAAAGAGAAGVSSMAALMAATTAETSTVPSPPVASIEVSSERTVSTIWSSTLVRVGVSSRAPSRRRDSMFSPPCVTSSSRLKARKPLVPLMVWIVRKMLDSRSREFGSCSRATRSESSWSRFSWLSTRNSSTMSSRPSTVAAFSLTSRTGTRARPVGSSVCRRRSQGESVRRQPSLSLSAVEPHR